MNATLKRTGAALVGSSLLLALQGAASAHFVWAEPDTASGKIRVCFGEYPSLKEGAPLLDKVARVKAYALVDGQKRELSSTKQADHFLFEGMGAAPAAVALLDYGVLERPGTPPFMLRYEAQLLLGDGKPLAARELARLGSLKTGLPLSIAMDAARADRIGLRVSLDGKPAAAEIACQGPGETEMQQLKTSPAGYLELPVPERGWYHLRIKAEDGKPVRVEGKDVGFTRTYLSLMFQAAGSAAPAAAAAEPAGPASPVVPDADAVKILKEAHVARAHWGPSFPGFTADAVYRLNGKEAKGTITVKADFTIEYNLGNKELEAAIGPSFGSLIMHRRSSGGAPDYQATWRGADPHALGRAINLNDELGSFYRVRDRQIMQVNRSMGAQRFTNNVIRNEQTKLGFLPRAWAIAYYDRESNKLLRASTTTVTWAWIGDVFMPATLETMTARDADMDASLLTLSDHRLLK